jgi:hypothetical protein
MMPNTALQQTGAGLGLFTLVFQRRSLSLGRRRQ